MNYFEPYSDEPIMVGDIRTIYTRTGIYFLYYGTSTVNVFKNGILLAVFSKKKL